ncbi:MAG: cytochrome c oxidase subunit II [Planctomycetota bacterium]
MSDPQPTPARKANPAAVLIGFAVLAVGEGIVLWQAGVFDGFRLQPEVISTIGPEVDHLFYLILGITGIAFALTFSLLLYFLVRYRARPGGQAVHTHGSHKLELAWTLVPGLILFFLAVYQVDTWGKMKFPGRFPDERQAYVVQVLGRQFEWRFRHAGADGEFGTADDVTKLGELHIPVDTIIVVQLRTLDVVHSFWLPNARIKQDLLPSQTIRQWFEIVKTGNFQISCAELCGVGHTKMAGRLIVHPKEDFGRWLQERKREQGDHVPELDPYWRYWPQG